MYIRIVNGEKGSNCNFKFETLIIDIQVRPPGSPRTSVRANDALDYALDDERKTRIRVRSLSNSHHVVNINSNLLNANHLEGDVITQPDSIAQDFEVRLYKH